MVDINCYLYDGANWQAQSVMSYVRTYSFAIKDNEVLETLSEEDRAEVMRLLKYVHIEVGRYENCREQGYTFSVFCFSKRLNITVFEHRNSDILCLNVFEGSFLNTPTWEDVWRGKEDKWDYDYEFKFGDIVGCGQKVIDLFKEFVVNEIVKKFVSKLSDKC